MGAAWKLNTNVHVVERDSAGGLTGRSATFGPGDEVPGWAVVAISNPDVWESRGSRSELPAVPDLESGPPAAQHAGTGDLAAELDQLRAELAALRAERDQSAKAESQATPTEPAADTPPPKGGAGSGAQAWRDYATSKGVEVPADASREDVIATLDAAGVPTE